jgi:hypothetical protein
MYGCFAVVAVDVDVGGVGVRAAVLETEKTAKRCVDVVRSIGVASSVCCPARDAPSAVRRSVQLTPTN